jgi:hypothetical protein
VPWRTGSCRNPTLQTIAPQETQEQRPEAYGQAAGEEEVKGFIVEGDLFAGYGLHQKAIDQYQRVVDAIPHHIEAHEKIRDMYAKGGELSKAAKQCLILANIFTARSESENANRNFALAYQYDPQLHQSPIYQEVAATSDEPQTPAAKPARRLHALTCGCPKEPRGAPSRGRFLSRPRVSF